MSQLETPFENELALEKAVRTNERAIKQGGYGDSDHALWITKGYLQALTDLIEEDIKVLDPNHAFNDAKLIIGQLPPHVIALCALNTVLHGVAIEQKLTSLFVNLGENISAECWAAGLTKHDPKLAARVDRLARGRHYRADMRRKAARSIAKRAGYTLPRWSTDRRAHAGNWLVDCVSRACPGVFELDQRAYGFVLTLADGYREEVERAVQEMIMHRPVSLPTKLEPAPWGTYRMDHEDQRVCYEKTFTRTPYKDVAAAAKSAIIAGTAKPALAAVSSLQAVPWRINKRIYGVLRGCMERGIKVKGLPGPDVEVKNPDDAQYNRKLRSDRLLLDMDIRTAEYLYDDRFWTAFNCDWRGRLYALPHFNFQREDRVRALFEFADGLPMGEDGLRWLQLHVANCGDFDKISKQTIEDRVAWTIKNTARIQEMVETPLTDLWWTQADKPFLFLAACLELDAAVRVGQTFVTRLPVSFDGSCSGLQHLSAMTKDEHTARLVNLTNNEKPSDVYSVVADAVVERLKNDKDPLAAKFLAYLGDDKKKQRSLAKRNVMTYAYSSKKFGMAGQQQTDLMDELVKEVVEGKIKEHPFADPDKKDDEQPYKPRFNKEGDRQPGPAARFIAAHVFAAIEQQISRPAKAMKFLQKIARALAHEGKPVRWVTPAGLPWINRYHYPQTMRLSLWMHDRGVDKRNLKTLVTVGGSKEIHKDKAANGIAPNLVHACDAAHLMLTVNASVAAGIHSIATVHDSFGCLAPQAALFNKIIRQEFVRMYDTHDVLAEIRESALRDLTQHNWHRVPEVTENGNFQNGEVNDARYCFA